MRNEIFICEGSWDNNKTVCTRYTGNIFATKQFQGVLKFGGKLLYALLRNNKNRNKTSERLGHAFVIWLLVKHISMATSFSLTIFINS